MLTARLSLIAVVFYQVLLIALIFIRPDIDPSWHTISEWARGPHGWIMSTAFIISALGYGFLFWALKSQAQGVLGKIGLTLLFICFLGTVGVGLFTTDPYPPEKNSTAIGIVHTISGSLAMLLLPLAAIFTSLSLAKNKTWASVRRILLIIAWLPLVAFVSFVVHLSLFVIPMGDYYGPGLQIGWPPRIMFLTYGIWVILVALQTIKVHRNIIRR